MKTIIAKMRADWVVVAEDRRALGDWSEDDEQEIGSAVRAAIQKGDQDLIALWARWLADLSAITLGLAVAKVTDKMREQVKKQKGGSA